MSPSETDVQVRLEGVRVELDEPPGVDERRPVVHPVEARRRGRSPAPLRRQLDGLDRDHLEPRAAPGRETARRPCSRGRSRSLTISSAVRFASCLVSTRPRAAGPSAGRRRTASRSSCRPSASRLRSSSKSLRSTVGHGLACARRPWTRAAGARPERASSCAAIRARSVGDPPQGLLEPLGSGCSGKLAEVVDELLDGVLRRAVMAGSIAGTDE